MVDAVGRCDPSSIASSQGSSYIALTSVRSRSSIVEDMERGERGQSDRSSGLS